MGVGLERNDGRQQQHHQLRQYQQREPQHKPQGQPMKHRHHPPWHPELEQQQDIRAVVRSGSNNSNRTCIDDYETARPIGKGKFAIVYRAKRRKDGKTVALKRVSMSDMGEKFRTKCMREVRLLQSLDHCNIIRYQDSFLDNNELVIVLEWAAAGDLKRQVRKALERAVHFEERVIWGYFSQICGAISYMHRMKIMHRDIKPANIFLTLKGQVKVGDLGLGRVMSAEDDLAYSKVGTPLYMSVEVLGGGGYSWKSDVWSLGCVLYELAMLRSPFKSESLSLYSLYKKISSGDYPPMLAYYSEELRALATGMINTNPNERPSVHEAHAIALAMKRKLAGKGIPATLPPQIARQLKPKNPAPRKIAAATTATTAARNPPPSRRAVTSGDERRGGVNPRRHGPAGFALDSGTPALAEGAAMVPPSIDQIGAVVEATSAAIRTRTTSSRDLRPEQTGEAATAGALAHGLGGYSNNVDDDRRCHHQQQHHHHHHHHHHHRHHNNRYHPCHHDKMDGNGNSNSHTRRERNDGVASNDWKHHEKLKLQLQQHQQQRHAMGEPRLSGNKADHRVSSGTRDGKNTIVEAAVPTQAHGEGGDTTAASVTIGNEERQRANGTATSILTSASAMNDRADATKNRHQHNPEQHSVVLAAPWFEIAQTATPQPLPIGAVVTASGIVLPRVRVGSLAAKVKAAKAAAAAAAAAASARESEGAGESRPRWSPSPPPPPSQQPPLGPAVVRFNDANPVEVNGADPRCDGSQAVVVGMKGELASRAPAWEQPTQSKQPEERPTRTTTLEDDTNSRAPAVPAGPSVAAGDGARGSTLPAVVVGRRSRATSANKSKSKSNSGTTATSSPSSSSTPSSRGRGEEHRHESNSSSGGTRSRSGGDGGAIEGEGEGGGGGGGSRHDDVEMMMAAENNDDRDDKECGNRRRTQERQERRKKKSDHNNKRCTTHNSEAGNDSSRSKSVSSFSVPSSPCLPPGESAACVDVEKKKDMGTEAKETETTTTGAAAALSGRKAREGKQRRRRHGRSAGSAVVNATAAVACADNAATTAVEAADNAASAAPERGCEAVAASAARSVPVSGENIVAMQALSDCLSILGYDKDLRTRNKPPLSRLHFAVPGADSGGDCDDDGDRGNDRSMLFPSHQEHFLDFVALSKWLLEQLGGGGGGYADFESAATDAPAAVCADILQACQRLGFEPSEPKEEVGGTVGTGSSSPPAASAAAAAAAAVATISPTNLAVGSGTAVLELLGWLSHAALNKVKTTLSRGLGNREDERKWGQEVEAKRLTDYSDERGTQDEEDGVVVRRPGKGPVGVTKGKSGETTIASRVKGGNRAEAGRIGRHGRSDSASSNNNTTAGRRRDRVIHLSKKARAIEAESNERTAERASVVVPAAGARGNNSSSSGAGDNGRRRFALLPELASMMATTAVVSSSGGYTSCWCSCSCALSRCSCYTSQFGSSMDDGRGGGGGSGDLEDSEAVSCLWGRDSSMDGHAFMGSMIKPTVDPAAWRAEQERVAPRLARVAPPAGLLEVGTDSWAARVEVFRKAAAAISSAAAGGDSPPQAEAVAAAARSTTPGGHGNVSGDGYSSIGDRPESRGQNFRAMTTPFVPDINASKDRKECLESMLVRHKGEVLRQLKAVAAGERRVNNLHGGGSTGGGGSGSGHLPCFQKEAFLLRDQERAFLDELEERKARVAALTIELRDAEAAVVETEVEVKQAAANCSDPTKLYKTKSAIRQLKADVKAMDVLIGAKSAALVGKQEGVQRAAREAEHSAPVGSRWGGLNSRADRGGGGGRGARTALSTPSPSISPASVADTSSTEAATNTASTPLSGSSGGGSGGGGGGGVVRLVGKPKAPEVGDGAGGPRRGGVLVQAAMRLLATGLGNATATATQGRVGAEAEATALSRAEAGAGGNNQDHQVLAGHNYIDGDDWLDEKEREEDKESG